MNVLLLTHEQKMKEMKENPQTRACVHVRMCAGVHIRTLRYQTCRTLAAGKCSRTLSWYRLLFSLRLTLPSQMQRSANSTSDLAFETWALETFLGYTLQTCRLRTAAARAGSETWHRKTPQCFALWTAWIERWILIYEQYLQTSSMLSLPALQILLLQNPHACAHTGSFASNAHVSRDVRLNGLPHTAQDAVLDDSKKWKNTTQSRN